MRKKNNYSYIGISFIILVFGILFIPKIISRISNNTIVDDDRHHLERKKSNEEVLVTIGKVPSFKFINQDSDTITNQNYLGKVYVAEFFFTTCPSICPVMNQNMGKIEKEFLGENNFGIASFTINPIYDTPSVLKEYAQKYEMTHPNWNLLTGEQEEIYKLANEGFNLYVGEASEVEGGFEHSGFFALIDSEGNIRSRKDANGNPIIYYDGLEEETIKMLIEDIQKLLKN
tara:strand:- start:307 stop:996 length:690 start_codon:yes stop_codon:yes gene_type:complete